MHPVTFRKAMIEAYIAGAEAMASGDIDTPSKKDARDWYDNQCGVQEVQECDCCEENEDGDS